LIIFFDVDDTLIDHSGAERTAASLFYRRFRDTLAGLDEESFYARWHAAAERHFATYNAGECSYQDQRRRRIRAFFGSELSDREADELFAVYLVGYESQWALFPDVLPCLDALAGQTLGIISNNGIEATRLKLDRVQIADRFADVVTPDTIGISKPDRRIFEAACERLGVPPAACMYVGDMLENDACAASAAGLTGVWINRSGENRPTLDTEGIIVIHDLRDLPRVVGA
jgi:putative hydrolase of the HAD superfamily